MSHILKSKLDDLCRAGISQEMCDLLDQYIDTAPRERLFGISPYRLADSWDLDRNEVLDAFLYATKAGIFDLVWDIKCPSCRGVTTVFQSLRQMTAKSHCDYCRIDIQGGFDDAVEISFQVNHNVKSVETPHALDVIKSWAVQISPCTMSADPGESQEMKLDLEPGIYHLSDSSYRKAAPLWIKTGQAKNNRTVVFNYDGDQLLREETNWYTAGPVTIRLNNQGDYNQEFTFCRAEEFPWVSGADLACNQFFRDYFSSELISADETFAVRNMVFVFTDIKGSTDLYEKRGDSQAYYLVKEHFKIMNNIVKKHNGAIVKTIGDAVMATFRRSEEGVKAVFEMHEEFDRFNEVEHTRDDIIIKIGIHRGGCLAVTSNDKLDYFGRTVNIAARIQGLSGGRDVMISQSLYEEPGVDGLIDSNHYNSREVQATLKGIEGFYKVVHLYKI